MLLRRQLAQLDPDTVLHGGVVQIDLKPVPHDDSAARESKDVLHCASRGRVVRSPARRGGEGSAFGPLLARSPGACDAQQARTRSPRSAPARGRLIAADVHMTRGVPTGTG